MFGNKKKTQPENQTRIYFEGKNITVLEFDIDDYTESCKKLDMLLDEYDIIGHTERNFYGTRIFLKKKSLITKEIKSCEELK